MSLPYSNIVRLATGASSAKRTLSGKSKRTLITVTKDCFIAFNVDTITAAMGYYLKAGEQYTFDILYPTKIAGIQSSEAGVASIMEFGDSVLKITEAATFTSNSNLKSAPVSTTITGDTYFLKERTDTYDGNASIKKVVNATLTGDANIYKAASSTNITGDTNLVKTVESSLKADAFIAAGDSFSGNASLKGTEEATFKSDANLLDDKNVGTFQADAILITY